MFLKTKKWTDFVLHIIIVSGLGILFVLGIFKIYLPNFTHHRETVTMFNLEGKSLEKAGVFLKERNFRYKVMSDSAYNADLPPYTIISHLPAPESIIKENRLIYLKINKKEPPKVKMPALIDLSIDIAEIKLNSLGLNVGEKIYKPDAAYNAVLKQLHKGKEIASNTLIQKGETIVLVIGNGLGSQQFKMPNIVGMLYEEAELLIKGSNLKIGLMLEEDIPEYSESYENFGLVTRQAPKAKENVRVGDSVDLWIKDLRLYQESINR